MSNRIKKPIFRNIFFIFLFILLGSAVAFSATVILSMRPPEGNKTLNRSGRVSDVANLDDSGADVPKGTPANQVFTFLIAGKDQVSNNTDTIMLVKLDIAGKSINILNIPRDTMLDTDRKYKKINSSYQIDGIRLLEEDVASITGFYVNRYVLFNLEGVEKIIDAIGGVDYDVPRNMNYDDPTQDLHIHLRKGFQHLDGKQAVGLARYRYGYTNGDIGRINTQQDLLKALVKQALKPENILKLPELVRLVNENVETDIDLNEMLWLANQVKDFPVSSIDADVVPGVASTIDHLSYWLPYKNELLALINEKFNPLDTPITEEDIDIVVYPENEGR